MGRTKGGSEEIRNETMNSLTDYAYEGVRRVTYDTGGGEAVFVPVCSKCGRFAKADKEILVGDLSGLADQPNATCSRCGRIMMLFEGFF